MKKVLLQFLAASLCAALLAGCGPSGSAAPAGSQEPAAPVKEASSAQAGGREEGAGTPEGGQPRIRLAGLKGPTTMGMVKLLDDAQQGLSENHYDFSMTGTADDIVARLAKGEVDAAAVPCNLASVLYHKMEGQISVAAINTLGVLYVVETGEGIQSLADLKGKTLYATGKGTTPQFALDYVLTQNGLDPQKDLTVEYKSEATEVAALLAEDSAAVALLPEPFVTTAQAKNEKIRTALDLTAEWDKLQNGSALVTGVIIARNAFIEENGAAFQAFLREYEASIAYVNAHAQEAAALVERYGIAPAAVAAKAIPKCNITYIDGAGMREKIDGYLRVLLEQNPQSVGGSLPDDAFYYQG